MFSLFFNEAFQEYDLPHKDRYESGTCNEHIYLEAFINSDLKVGACMTNNNRVDVFFYGSYMNFDVLMNLGISKREYHVGQLPGYELTIGSAANVVKNGLERVFGIVTQLTHDELDTLYSREAQAKLGAQYMPEPVLVMTANRNIVPSLCYIAYDRVAGVASAAYIDTILSAARKYDFPQSYIDHVESYTGVSPF